LTGQVEGKLVTVIGRGKLSAENLSAMPPVAPGLECVLLIDGKLTGVIHFRDEPRRESKSFLGHLDSKHHIVGVLLGLVSVRYVESLLYGVKGTDVSMLVMPCAMLLGAALLASLPAVLRAVRIDPAVMLRAE
jgi:hypothetical protein